MKDEKRELKHYDDSDLEDLVVGWAGLDLDAFKQNPELCLCHYDFLDRWFRWVTTHDESILNEYDRLFQMEWSEVVDDLDKILAGEWKNEHS